MSASDDFWRILTVTVHAVTEGSLSIVPSVGREEETRAVGEAISLPCTIQGDGYDFFLNVILWYKVLDDGTEVILSISL